MLFLYFFFFHFYFSECRSLLFSLFISYTMLKHVYQTMLWYTITCYAKQYNVFLFPLPFLSFSCILIMCSSYLPHQVYHFLSSSSFFSFQLCQKDVDTMIHGFMFIKQNHRYSGAQKMKIKAEALESWELEKWLR